MSQSNRAKNLMGAKRALITGEQLTAVLLTVGLAAFLSGCRGGNHTPSSSGSRNASSPAAGATENSTIADSDASQFYQQLLAQYGEDYGSCLQSVTTGAPGKPTPAQPAQVKKQLNVIVAFDSSGSMAERVIDGRKIDLAKAAVERFLGGLPEEAKVGLVVYGHKGSNQPSGKAVSCAGVEELYALAALDKSKLAQAVQTFQPTGYTPLAASINRSGEMLTRYAGETQQNVVYVVSDGLETCGGDAVAAARAVHNSNTKAVINIIGFNVGNAEQRQLREVAQAGGGEYFSAQNGADLNRVFTNTTNILKTVTYGAKNARMESETVAKYGAVMSRFTACIGVRLSSEESRLFAALIKLRPADANYRHVNYVRERMRERRSQIEAFQRQSNQNLNNQRAIDMEQLRRDLDEVTKDFKGRTP